MIHIDKLSPGQVVFDVHSYRMGNTTIRSVGVWNVLIVEIDPDKKWVIASWNHNPPQKYFARCGKFQWRAKEPELVSDGLARRIKPRSTKKAGA